MSDTKATAKIRAKHKELKGDLRQIQRDFRSFLNETKNQTGQHVRDGKDFYERQVQKAANKLNTFESKNDLDKYKNKPEKKLKMPSRGGGSMGGGSIKTPDEYGNRRNPVGTVRKMSKGGFLAPASRPLRGK